MLFLGNGSILNHFNPKNMLLSIFKTILLTLNVDATSVAQLIEAFFSTRLLKGDFGSFLKQIFTYGNVYRKVIVWLNAFQRCCMRQSLWVALTVWANVMALLVKR